MLPDAAGSGAWRHPIAIAATSSGKDEVTALNHRDSISSAMTQATTRIDAFHRLHESGCFVIPNPWDVGSARVLAQLGFPALATTSSGFAWSMGRRDNDVTLDEALGALRGDCRQR